MTTEKQKMVSCLRGIAIIMVVLVHLSDTLFPDGPAKTVFSFGQMGCQIFFLLSCYCLCFSWEKGLPAAFPFYRKRFLALAPGYWLAILISLIFFAIARSCFFMETKLLAIAQNVLLLHGLTLDWSVMNSVVHGGWFIGTLMVFYLLFPLMYRIYFNENCWWKKYRIVLFPVILTLVSSSLMVISGLGSGTFCENNSVKYFSFINQLPSFFLGFSLYDAVRNDRRPGLLVPVLFLFVAVFLFFAKTKVSFILCPTVMSCAVALFFLWTTKKEVRLGNLPGKVLCVLGDSSYSIFLSHFWAVSLGALLIMKGCPVPVSCFVALILIALFAFLFDRGVNRLSGLIRRIV